MKWFRSSSLPDRQDYWKEDVATGCLVPGTTKRVAREASHNYVNVPAMEEKQGYRMESLRHERRPAAGR